MAVCALLRLLRIDKVVKKILDYLGIDEFKRDRPPPKRLQTVDLFDDFSQDDYTDCDYNDY